jgi:hydroxypyruvate isomerase
VLEPLNSLIDHNGYFLDNPYDAADIVRAVHHPSVGLLFDCYHMQIMGGNLIQAIRDNVDVIRHFHSAGVPGRHDLDDGELNYPRIVDAIAATGYKGCFGLEYFPNGDSAESLANMRRLLKDRQNA